MFLEMKKIKEKYGCEISDYTMEDFSGNKVIFFYEFNFDGDFSALVKGDYYMLSVETFLKFYSQKEIKTDDIVDIIFDLDNLRFEIKNYFENLREKA